jgi:hypothetical protein
MIICCWKFEVNVNGGFNFFFFFNLIFLVFERFLFWWRVSLKFLIFYFVVTKKKIPNIWIYVKLWQHQIIVFQFSYICVHVFMCVTLFSFDSVRCWSMSICHYTLQTSFPLCSSLARHNKVQIRVLYKRSFWRMCV